MHAAQTGPLPAVAFSTGMSRRQWGALGYVLVGMGAGSLFAAMANSLAAGAMSRARVVELGQTLVATAGSIGAWVAEGRAAREESSQRASTLHSVAQAFAASGIGFFAATLLPAAVAAPQGEGIPPASLAIAAGGLACVAVAGFAAGVNAWWPAAAANAPLPGRAVAPPPPALTAANLAAAAYMSPAPG